MVRLQETSSINPQNSPILHQWDQLVRKNLNQYQKLIDARTYELQRAQRFILARSYPNNYDSSLVTLNLLKKKQRVGEVTKQEIDTYSNINPSIRCHFENVFNTSFLGLPKAGFAIGTGLLAYSTIFNFSVPTRIMYFVLPVFAGYVWGRRTTSSEVQTSQFLDWVFQYRKARVFNESNRHLFNSAETLKVIGKGNLVQLGQELVSLAR